MELYNFDEREFDDEKADKYVCEVEDLHSTIYDLMCNSFGMGAEANLFYTVKPDAIQSYDNGFSRYEDSIDRWNQVKSVLEAKCKELRKIIENMK
jgi:hypothetical protein